MQVFFVHIDSSWRFCFTNSKRLSLSSFESKGTIRSGIKLRNYLVLLSSKHFAYTIRFPTNKTDKGRSFSSYIVLKSCCGASNLMWPYSLVLFRNLGTKHKPTKDPSTFTKTPPKNNRQKKISLKKKKKTRRRMNDSQNQRTSISPIQSRWDSHIRKKEKKKSFGKLTW